MLSSKTSHLHVDEDTRFATPVRVNDLEEVPAALVEYDDEEMRNNLFEQFLDDYKELLDRLRVDSRVTELREPRGSPLMTPIKVSPETPGLCLTVALKLLKEQEMQKSTLKGLSHVSTHTGMLHYRSWMQALAQTFTKRMQKTSIPWPSLPLRKQLPSSTKH